MQNFLLVLVAVIILMLAINSTNHSNLRNQNSISGIDITKIEEPIQTLYDGQREKVNINGLDMEIEKLYSYEITGKVIKTYNYEEYYTGNKTYNTIASKDVGIVWGKLAEEKNLEKMEFEMRGGRTLRITINDTSLFSNIGGEDNFWYYISNNHLITTDEKILKLIDEIKEGDLIQIKGYLINVYGDNFRLTSSVIRTDHGNHGCEVLLVEDIKWIK